MKRHTQLTGIRNWSGDDLLELQSEPLKALDHFFAQYGPCLIEGCAVTRIADGTCNIAPGLVALEAEDRVSEDLGGGDHLSRVMVMPFHGAAGIRFPLWLTAEIVPNEEFYADGNQKAIAYHYRAVALTEKPEHPALELTGEDIHRFVDVLQDPTHRFITDEERAAWNAVLGLAKDYTDRRETEIREDMRTNDETTLTAAKEYTDQKATDIRTDTSAELNRKFDKAGGTVSGNVALTGTLDVTGAITGNLTGNVKGDLDGNAATATKLLTARTINGKPFDGTENISIGRLDPMEISSGRDLNELTNPGMYYCQMNSIVQSLANSPSELAFALLVERHTGIKQTWTEYSTANPKTYSRNYHSGEWGDWYRVYTTVDPPANATPTADGLMSADDKTTLDGIKENYVPILKGTLIQTNNILHYILLFPLYEGTYLGNSFMYGTVSAVRGSSGTYNRKLTVELCCGAAYTAYTAHSFSMGEPSKLVSCYYDGKKYMALQLGKSQAKIENLKFRGSYLNGTNDPNFFTDVEASKLSEITDIGTNVFLDEVYTKNNLTNATPKTEGLMSAADKNTLDGVQAILDDKADKTGIHNDLTAGKIGWMNVDLNGFVSGHYLIAQRTDSDGAATRLKLQAGTDSKTARFYNTVSVSGADKLTTARTINGTAFDGTADISFGRLVPIVLTQGDNDNYTQPGMFCAQYDGIAASVSNAPTTRAFSLLVERHAGTKQTVTEFLTTNPKTYSRNFYSGAWGAWYRIYTTVDKPANATTTAAGLMSADDKKKLGSAIIGATIAGEPVSVSNGILEIGEPGASDATFIVDSDQTLKDWATNTSGNDYTVVRIAAGEYTCASVNLTTTRTKRVVGEPGNRITFTSRGFRYDTVPQGCDYSMEGVNVVINSNASPAFSNCINLQRCSSITNDGANSNTYTHFSFCNFLIDCHASGGATGFSDCSNLTDCTASVTNTTNNSATGFISCSQLVNCRATRNNRGFAACQLMSTCIAQDGNVGFTLCHMVTGCRAENCGSYGFSQCRNLSTCTAQESMYGFGDCDVVSAGYVFSTLNNSMGFSNSKYLNGCWVNCRGIAFSYCTKLTGCHVDGLSTKYSNCSVSTSSTVTPSDTAAGGWNS